MRTSYPTPFTSTIACVGSAAVNLPSKNVITVEVIYHRERRVRRELLVCSATSLLSAVNHTGFNISVRSIGLPLARLNPWVEKSFQLEGRSENRPSTCDVGMMTNRGPSCAIKRVEAPGFCVVRKPLARSRKYQTRLGSV